MSTALLSAAVGTAADADNAVDDTPAAHGTSVRRAGTGTTRITAGALEQVVSAVTGDALGVAAHRVHATLADRSGSLDITASAPIRVISIARLRDEPAAIERSGGSILDRCARAEHEIRERVQAMTGYTVDRVALRLSDVRIQPERRVR